MQTVGCMTCPIVFSWSYFFLFFFPEEVFEEDFLDLPFTVELFDFLDLPLFDTEPFLGNLSASPG